MPFQITPAAAPGSTPVARQTVPQFIQFRYNGVDLGGPDATVVDFVGDGLVIARGTGDDADKLTVSLG